MCEHVFFFFKGIIRFCGGQSDFVTRFAQRGSDTGVGAGVETTTSCIVHYLGDDGELGLETQRAPGDI